MLHERTISATASEARRAPRPFGLDFTPLSAEEIVDGLLGRPPGAGEGPRLLVTTNVDHVVQLGRDAAFRAAYRSAWMITADGMPVYLCARRHRPELQGRIAGSDLIAAMIGRFDPSRHRPFFVCADIGTASRLGSRLAARGFDGDKVGFASPPYGFERDVRYSLALAQRIQAHRTTHLAIGLGAPKSEIWAHRWRHMLGSCYVLPVGAGLEYAVGIKRRAPCAFRSIGLEWAWRLALEPQRLFRRYAVDSWRFLAAVRDDARGRPVLPPHEDPIEAQEAR